MSTEGKMCKTGPPPLWKDKQKKITGSVALRAVESGFGDSNKPRFMDSACS